MRIVLSFVTALLLILFVVGVGSGQRLQNCCHKDMQMANCTCDAHSAIMNEVAEHGSSVALNCCMSGTCGLLLVRQDFILAAISSPFEFADTSEKLSFAPFMHKRILGYPHFSLSSPHLPSAPIYNLHCSFLI